MEYLDVRRGGGIAESRDAQPAATPYHGQLSRLEDLRGLVEPHGIPAPSWSNEHQNLRNWSADVYIEVQLWSDEPVLEFLADRTRSG